MDMKNVGTTYNGEHDENYYVWMMEALDGELAAGDRFALDAHLRTCPRCAREWEALLAVESLLRQTPLLWPAADFAQRTLALLPDRRYRLWAIGVFYLLVLLSGIVPLFLGAWAMSRLAPILSQPEMLQAVLDAIARPVQLFFTVLDALAAAAGRFVIEQPALVGSLLVMAGLIFLWGSVYQRLVLSPQGR
jgi:anti-sigma factor RsiW